MAGPARAVEDRPPAGGAESPDAPDAPDTSSRRSRSAVRDEAARAALVPLREGERPRAVTVAAVVALLVAVANLGSFAAGFEIRGERPRFVSVLAPSLLLLLAAYGMWRVRYWAVLGMQTLLALVIVLFSLLVIRAEDLSDLLIAGAMIVGCGTLFWFLVKAMARIQMPVRR